MEQEIKPFHIGKTKEDQNESDVEYWIKNLKNSSILQLKRLVWSHNQYKSKEAQEAQKKACQQLIREKCNIK